MRIKEHKIERLYHKILFFLVALLCIACEDKEQEDQTPLNLSDDYSVCNSQLAACINGTGDYCLFGFKWGADSSFSQRGYEVQGPASSGGIVTYSFQEENGLINTHRQINLASNTFDDVPFCAKTEIRNALGAWAAVSNIEFDELPENSIADIRFYIADIIQSGIGYPNYSDERCTDLAGNVIIKSNVRFNDCESFYLFVLHEIGHVLGLGHVNTANIMNPDLFSFDFTTLQDGDIDGITQIYGEN